MLGAVLASTSGITLPKSVGLEQGYNVDTDWTTLPEEAYRPKNCCNASIRTVDKSKSVENQAYNAQPSVLVVASAHKANTYVTVLHVQISFIQF